MTVIEWNKFEHFDGKVIKIDVKTLAETEREYDITLLQDENGKPVADEKEEDIQMDAANVDENQTSDEAVVKADSKDESAR